MPYGVFETGPDDKPYCVYKKNPAGEAIGDSLGCHPSEDDADGQIAAIWASETAKKPKIQGINEKTEWKTVPFVATLVDEDQGIVEHLIAVMGNVDLGGDIVQPGAFTKTLSQRGTKIRVLDQHRTDTIMSVIGKPISVWEIGTGQLPAKITKEFPEATGALMARTQFLMDTPEGLGAFKRIKAGAVDEYSFAYDPIVSDFTKVKSDGREVTVRNLREVRLWEYGPVIFGMNPAARTMSAKSGPELGKKQLSLEDEMRAIGDAFRVQFPAPVAELVQSVGSPYWVRETYPDHVIVEEGNTLWSVPYTMIDGKYTFSVPTEWTKVEETYVPKSRRKGGPGSGNWGHEGRPGERGGSAGGGGGGGGGPTGGGRIDSLIAARVEANQGLGGTPKPGGDLAQQIMDVSEGAVHSTRVLSDTTDRVMIEMTFDSPAEEGERFSRSDATGYAQGLLREAEGVVDVQATRVAENVDGTLTAAIVIDREGEYGEMDAIRALIPEQERLGNTDTVAQLRTRYRELVDQETTPKSKAGRILADRNVSRIHTALQNLEDILRDAGLLESVEPVPPEGSKEADSTQAGSEETPPTDGEQERLRSLIELEQQELEILEV